MPIVDRSTKRVFLEIAIDGTSEGKIMIELFDKIAPRTCENFRALCTGEYGRVGEVNMTYKGSIFHRVIKGFMIQGGDITAGNGTGGSSIYGRTFDDEEFMESHTEPYLVSMANKGPNTNSSQFFITTAIARNCDAKHVVFGRVVRGKEIVDKIERMTTNADAKPYQDVMVVNCGELFKKSRPQDENQKSASPSNIENEKKEDSVALSTVRVEDLPPEPKSTNWLMRRSRTPEKVRDERDKKSSDRRRKERGNSRDSRDRRDRRSHKDRRRSRTRSRSPRRSPDRNSRHRSGPRNYIEDRNERLQRETGVKVKGRGALRFQREDRDVTPPHWRREEGKKQTLSEYQARKEKEEQRKKDVEIREKKEAAEREEREKERRRRSMERELRRNEKSKRRSSSGSDRSPSPKVKKEEAAPRKAKSPSPPPSSSSSESDSDRD